MASVTKCPRCGEDFQCRPDDIEACECFGVSLGTDTKAYLENTSYACLCPSCLVTLDETIKSLRGLPFSPNAKLIEGEHYYMDNGMFVFTEKYHIWKGYCCQKGCRHCAYGYHINSAST